MKWLDKLLNKFGYVRLESIKIYPEFREHTPRSEKMRFKRMIYKVTGQFEQPIVINKLGYLEDGYTSYLIAKEENFKYVKIKRT